MSKSTKMAFGAVINFHICHGKMAVMLGVNNMYSRRVPVLHLLVRTRPIPSQIWKEAVDPFRNSAGGRGGGTRPMFLMSTVVNNALQTTVHQYQLSSISHQPVLLYLDYHARNFQWSCMICNEFKWQINGGPRAQWDGQRPGPC